MRRSEEQSEPAVPLGAPPVPLAPATAPPDAPAAAGTGVEVDAPPTGADLPEPPQEELVVLLMELLVLVVVASGSAV